jgi:hypothetical protein
VLQKFSTARPSSSVTKHKLLRDTKKQTTDEDGRAVENICNTLFKCINYNLHEEMFCFNVIYLKIFFTFFFLETNTKRKQQFLKQIRMIIFIENK